MYRIPTLEEIERKRNEQSEFDQSALFRAKRQMLNFADTSSIEDVINVESLLKTPIIGQSDQVPADNSGAVGFSSFKTVNLRASTSSGLSTSKSISCILVNVNQKGNALLKFFKNVRWEHSDIPCDYQLGNSRGSLFLSLKYHKLHSEYVYTRMNAIKDSYEHKILICLVDIPDHEDSVRELTKVGYIFQCTLIMAWSYEEAARYLEMYLAYQKKPMDSIKEKVDPDYLSRLTEVLTSVRSVNKTDIITLSTNFGNLKKISNASMEELILCPGLGDQKAQRLHGVFTSAFK